MDDMTYHTSVSTPVTNLSPHDLRPDREKGFHIHVVILIWTGSGRGFTRTSLLGLEQLVHDICDNSIFTLLFEGLTIWDVNADPIFDLGTLKTHLERGIISSRMEIVRGKTTYVRKLANNASAANFDSRSVVGRSGRVAAVTGTTDRTAADSVMTAWDADHLKGRELSPALANEKGVVLCFRISGGIDVNVDRRNIGGGLSNITGGKKVGRSFTQAWKVKRINVRIRCVGPLPFHSLGLLFGPVQRLLGLIFGFSGKKPRLPLLR